MLFIITGSFFPAIQSVNLPVTGATLESDIPASFAAVPNLEDFAHALANGDKDRVVGVYAADTLALPVTQQPARKPNFVSPLENVATQFETAKKFNTIGILAHNYLSGDLFYDLSIDQLIAVVYGDGSYQFFQVSEIQQFQALSPNSPQSNFVDLSGSNATLSAVQLFEQIYAPGDRLVLQTCIAAEGEPSWGRIFIIATPLSSLARITSLRSML